MVVMGGRPQADGQGADAGVGPPQRHDERADLVGRNGNVTTPADVNRPGGKGARRSRRPGEGGIGFVRPGKLCVPRGLCFPFRM